jgi:hypothetical protein
LPPKYFVEGDHDFFGRVISCLVANRSLRAQFPNDCGPLLLEKNLGMLPKRVLENESTRQTNQDALQEEELAVFCVAHIAVDLMPFFDGQLLT